VNDFDVAPGTSTFPTIHWKAIDAFGDQAPLSAVSGTPTWAEPTTAGSRLFTKVPGTTGIVGAELATASA